MHATKTSGEVFSLLSKLLEFFPLCTIITAVIIIVRTGGGVFRKTRRPCRRRSVSIIARSSNGEKENASTNNGTRGYCVVAATLVHPRPCGMISLTITRVSRIAVYK